MNSQNIYEYKKIKPLPITTGNSRINQILYNKLNEVIIEQNHLMKDFELYKKAFKQYVSGGLLPLGWGDDLDDKTSRQPVDPHFIIDYHLAALKDSPAALSP